MVMIVVVVMVGPLSVLLFVLPFISWTRSSLWDAELQFQVLLGSSAAVRQAHFDRAAALLPLV